MGIATIPMAILTIASLVGGLVVLACGAWAPVGIGLLCFGFCMGIAPILEKLVVTIDDAAVRSIERDQRGLGRIVAVASGSVPMIVILAWEVFSFRLMLTFSGEAPLWALWLWSYGVAIAPWTLFALQVSRFRRTLCGIRAYAGHIAYWFLSLLVLVLHQPLSTGVASMLLPSILPFIVGMLLALADRDALRNVRV